MGLFVFLPPMVDSVLTGGTVAAGAACLTLYAWQRKLIYVPQFPAGSRRDVWRPEQFGWPTYEDVQLRSLDGTRLHGYWIPLDANAGNIGHRLPILRKLSSLLPCQIFMLSYRGYGLSEGTPDELGIKEDAQAGLQWLQGQKAVNARSLWLYGQSIGTAVALHLASQNPTAISGLILENAFLNMPEVARDVVPWLPSWLVHLLCHQRWPSDESLRELFRQRPDLPILFLTGTKDELIPRRHSQQLLHICLNSNPKGSNDGEPRKDEGLGKQIIREFPEGKHNDTCVQPGYYEAIRDFILAPHYSSPVSASK